MAVLATTPLKNVQIYEEDYVILLLCELDRQDISSSKIPSSELALLDVSPEPGITKSGIVLGVSPPRKSAHF
jgi:hypothetical protein